jgi:putative membrane protein
VDYLLGTILVFLASALVIWIVGRLNLGLTVDGFMPAIIAAIVIAIVSAIVTWLLNTLGLNPGTGVVGAIVSLLVAAVILLLADKFVPGMRVNGFVGAIVAAIAIGVVAWLLTWLLGVLGIGVTVAPPV